MTNLFEVGYVICAKRGGVNFVEQELVEPFTRKCPTGYQPCSELTESTDTICIEPEKIETHCPILDILTLDSNDEAVLQKYRQLGYQIVEADDSSGGARTSSLRLPSVAFSKARTRWIESTSYAPIIGTAINFAIPCYGPESERLHLAEGMSESYSLQLPQERDLEPVRDC